MRAVRTIGLSLVGVSALLTVLVALDVVAPLFLGVAVLSLLAGIAVLVLRTE